MGSPLPPDVQKQLISGFSHLVANKYYVLASTVMLVYDHILTLERERRYIWKQRNSLPTYLFYIFRYSTPIISLINLIGEHAPWWTGPICTNWIWLPVASGVIVSAATGVILILRVHAIYGRAPWVLWISAPVYLAEIAVMIYAMPAGTAAPLPPGFIGCVPSEKPGTGHRLSYMYIAAMIFDAMIFIFTFGRAVYLRLNNYTRIPLLEIIFRDGTLYFTVLFIVNLVNVLLLSLAPADLSAINAPFATMITSVLVARLVLNLREAGQKSLLNTTNQPPHSQPIGAWQIRQAQSYRTTISGTMVNSGHRRSLSGNKDTTTFYDMLGLDEFDAPLGNVINNDEHPQDNIAPRAGNDYEMGSISRT